MGAAQYDTNIDVVSVRDVLGRVGLELRRSTAAVARLEEVIGELLFDKERQQAHLQVEIQNVDLVRQELAGLADFLAQLAPQIDDGVLVDIAPACAVVTVHALVSRLRACSPDDPVVADDHDGHEWFLV